MGQEKNCDFVQSDEQFRQNDKKIFRKNETVPAKTGSVTGTDTEYPKQNRAAARERKRHCTGTEKCAQSIPECPNPWILFRFYAIIKSESKERALSGIRENVTLQ